MAKGKGAAWMPLVRGLGLALGVDLLSQPLLALLAVKGVLPEERTFPAVAAACALGALIGALYCAARCPWGTLISGLACGAAMAAVLAAGGTIILPKQAGNGVTVTVVEAIGRRLADVHNELEAMDKA